MIEIAGDRVGPEETPYVIAEAGINARTDVQLSKAFINVAAESGADAIKFQTHLPDAEMVQSEMDAIGSADVYETVSECTLTENDHKRLQEHCRKQGITFLSTPFSVEAIDLLERIDVPAIKIGSGELSNLPLLKRAADTGKPLLISTGMSSLETVETTVEFLESHDAMFGLLYCVSNYPTDPSDFNFGVLSRYRERFDVPVGFSDHSTGVKAAAVAMAKGATVVEKHFTIDRRLPGPDQAVSIEPDELERLVAFADLVAKTSDNKKQIRDAERDVSEWAQHSIVTSQRVEEGALFTEDNLTTKRPATGIPAADFYNVVGTQAARTIESNNVLRESDIERYNDSYRG